MCVPRLGSRKHRGWRSLRRALWVPPDEGERTTRPEYRSRARTSTSPAEITNQQRHELGATDSGSIGRTNKTSIMADLPRQERIFT
jgi:hypothetical protein